MLELAPPPQLTPAEKLQVALELMAFGLQMKRQSLGREDPTADDEELGERLFAWLAEPR